MIGIIMAQGRRKLIADSSKVKARRRSKLIAQCTRQPDIDEVEF
jgi:hypothetical protein